MRQNKFGGSILGKGAKGVVIDSHCIYMDNETLCNRIKNMKITNMRVYTLDNKEIEIHKKT